MYASELKSFIFDLKLFMYARVYDSYTISSRFLGLKAIIIINELIIIGFGKDKFNIYQIILAF